MQTVVQNAAIGGWHAYDVAPVLVVATQNGRTGVSTTDGGTLVVWDLINAGEIRRLIGHESGVIGGLTFSTDDAYAVTADVGTAPALPPGDSDKMRLWDVYSGEMLQTYVGHTAYPTDIVVSDDSRYILSGGYDRTLRLWDLRTGEEIQQIAAHEGGIMAVAISPDGRFALSGSYTGDPPDSGVKLWDLQSGQLIAHVAKGTNITSLAFNRAGTLAFTMMPEFTFAAPVRGSGDLVCRARTGSRGCRVCDWDRF